MSFEKKKSYFIVGKKNQIFFFKKLLFLVCPTFIRLRTEIVLCATFPKMAKQGCRLQTRKQGSGLVRPQTQLSLKLWCGLDEERQLETRDLLPSTLWCTCMFTFWGLEWLTLPGMRNGILPVSMVVPQHISWRPTVCPHHAEPPAAALVSVCLGQEALCDLTFAPCSTLAFAGLSAA